MPTIGIMFLLAVLDAALTQGFVTKVPAKFCAWRELNELFLLVFP